MKNRIHRAIQAHTKNLNVEQYQLFSSPYEVKDRGRKTLVKVVQWRLPIELSLKKLGVFEREPRRVNGFELLRSHIENGSFACQEYDHQNIWHALTIEIQSRIVQAPEYGDVSRWFRGQAHARFAFLQALKHPPSLAHEASQLNLHM